MLEESDIEAVICFLSLWKNGKIHILVERTSVIFFLMFFLQTRLSVEIRAFPWRKNWHKIQQHCVTQALTHLNVTPECLRDSPLGSWLQSHPSSSSYCLPCLLYINPVSTKSNKSPPSWQSRLEQTSAVLLPRWLQHFYSEITTSDTGGIDHICPQQSKVFFSDPQPQEALLIQV